MAKLIVNIGVLPPDFGDGPIQHACTAEEALRFAIYVGQDVFIAGTLAYAEPPAITATAVLDRFSWEQRSIKAMLTNVHLLSSEIMLPNNSGGRTFTLREDADIDFFQTESSSLGTDLQEAFSPFTALDIYAEIAGQVRRNNQSKCSFSGVAVAPTEGTAMPIVPLEGGGTVHASNFIFLHDEPAHLFNQFAWTIGPDLEIIVDCCSMGTSVLATVNPSGKLLLDSHQGEWPDERALAWHRQRFFERFR